MLALMNVLLFSWSYTSLAFAILLFYKGSLLEEVGSSFITDASLLKIVYLWFCCFFLTLPVSRSFPRLLSPGEGEHEVYRQIPPAAPGGAASSVRLLLTKNPQLLYFQNDRGHKVFIRGTFTAKYARRSRSYFLARVTNTVRSGVLSGPPLPSLKG